MKQFLLVMVILAVVIQSQDTSAREQARPHHKGGGLQCVAFSPYVGNLNPDYGAAPSKQLIDQLLDQVVKEARFSCIMTYGVLNGLDYIFTSAKARHLKVFSILWLDKDIAVNSQSIDKGIEVAKAYPETIVRLSCGSEVRTRNGYAFDGEITRCIDSLRKAGVSQPITTIDTWWEWCNRSLKCGQTSFSAQVDWIGINVYPWWENKHSGIYPCTSAKKAADFHIARMDEIGKINPEKEVILTEFGWPNGPKDVTEVNTHTGQHCGIASKQNQAEVIKSTFKKLAQRNWTGVAFEAFSENWKPGTEGNVGGYWGICQGTPPYSCLKDLKGK